MVLFEMLKSTTRANFRMLKMLKLRTKAGLRSESTFRMLKMLKPFDINKSMLFRSTKKQFRMAQKHISCPNIISSVL